MTNTCWQVLELDAGSDASTIKRRYAQLLKVTRPDDDPEAFQRLRDAYETALGQARTAPRKQAASELPVAVEEAPQPLHVGHQEWLVQVFADLQLAQLDAHLATARERGWQGPFELRLLQHCLAAGEPAEAYVDWALTELHWLSPWQSLVLPEPMLEQLAERLLDWRISALAERLAAGDEAAALEGMTALWRSRWLENLDRQAQAKDALVQWLADEEKRTPALVEQLFTLLKVSSGEASDYRQGWAWNELLRYREAQRFAERLSKHLAMIWPVREEEQATWLLLKDMTAGDGRRLTDHANPRVWQACEQLENQLRHQFPEVLAQLRPQGLQDWRKWLMRAEGDWTNLLLMLVVFVGSAFNGLAKFLGGGPAPKELLTTALAMGGASLIVMLLLRGCWSLLDRVARALASVDAWLSVRLLPPFMANDGAGFLLLRHGVPCLLLGTLAGGWAAERGDYSWLYAGTITLSSVIYALGNLRRGALAEHRLVRYVQDVWRHSRAALGWTVLGAIIAIGLVTRGQQLATAQQSGAQQPCTQKTGEWKLKCEKRQIQLGD